MEKYRDLFTEKDTTQMSLFHKDNIQTYKKRLIEIYMINFMVQLKILKVII